MILDDMTHATDIQTRELLQSFAAQLFLQEAQVS